MSQTPLPAAPDPMPTEKISSTEFTLSENISALMQIKNENIARFAQGNINLTSALVEQKWHNRHQIYPYRIKEEIYGAVLSELMNHQPQLKNSILQRLEVVYQKLKNEEAKTLSRTRALLENTYKTPHL